jgi:hypothetical protein
VQRLSVISGGNAAEMLEPVETSLDDIPALVEDLAVRTGRYVVGAGWDDSHGVVLLNVPHNILAVIALIGNRVRGTESFEQGKSLRGVMCLPAGEYKAHGAALGVGGQVNLRGQSACGTPQSLTFVPPFPAAAC